MNAMPQLNVQPNPDLPPPLQRAKPLHFTHLAPPFDAFLGRIPESVAAIPSMMSIGEREFLYGVAKDYYTGAGLIIDAGTFLGASTVCLGSGLKQNPRLAEIKAVWPRPIVSFELGIANPTMLVSFKRHQIGGDLRSGDSFASIVENHIAPIAENVDMRFGDIMKNGAIKDETPKRKTPVEILFLDVLKSPELSEFCFREYFPRLIPRRSLVIQQDYINGDLPFIHIHQEFFASKFEYVGELASSAIFRLVRRITAAEIDELFSSPPDAEKRVALASQAAQRTIDNHRRVMMAFATLRMILQARGVEAAKQFWAFVETEYAPQIAQEQFRRVQNVVRASRYLCEVGPGVKNEHEAVQISTGHRGVDHRRTDV